MRLAFAPYVLRFKFAAGTSRGVMHEKFTLFLKLYDERNPEVYGLGEAAVFEGLSPEADSRRYMYKVVELLANIAIGRATDLSEYPSLQFGLEQAIRDYSSGGRGIYFPSRFTAGESSIPINGLVWMGRHDEMMRRLEEKVEAGFHCIKLKIGAIDWEEELDMIRHIRRRYSPEEITIRVDANGAFTPEDVMPRLESLAKLGVHSIEQPIKAGQPEEMAKVCRLSPVPVALDEELIGVFSTEKRGELLDTIRPAYIILKPALVGGFSGSQEWIDLAEERGIGWWITSALESSVGLNAIAQWTATLDTRGLPQGLGTGALYTNNAPSRLILEGERLRFDTDSVRDKEFFDNLDWRE